MKHWHHINPKHMGGSNDPSNLIELTIPQHAEAHKLLYVQYGKEEDRIAYLALSGQIGKEEVTRLAIVNGAKKRIGKDSSRFGIPGYWIDKKRPDESKRMKGNQYWLNRKNNGSPIGQHWKNEIVDCPHCEKSGGSNI